MTHGSLFSGIGGFDLAAEWAGWTNVFQVEWNKYCQQVLKKNFPDARIYGDIREFDGRPWRGTVDVISGGFPCQPYSSAGKRLGKDDERHLWPEMLRVIREAAPRWVVGENVRGLVNWSGGLVFDEVQADLEAAGYEVQPFLLPAASVNAPHIRYRVWFVAYRPGEQMGAAGQSWKHKGMESYFTNATRVGHEKRTQESNQKNTAKNGIRLDHPTERPRNAWPDPNTKGQQVWAGLCEGEQGRVRRRRPGDVGGKDDPNANNQRREEHNTSRIAGDSGQFVGGDFTDWANWPTQPPVCGRNDGVSNRVDRIAALGNAVVPQLVWRIFDTINQFEICQRKLTTLS